ncbi:MAG: hypothetical protein DMG37_24135 [Acidobacteria bacterium]|nr:MAG: hypothetical protein DMG37_24135 [Acidobacteriota bacterium]
MKTTTVSRFTSLNKFGVLACVAGLLILFAPQVRADDNDTSKDPPPAPNCRREKPLSISAA